MAKQNPNIYITDFKNGVDNKNEPIRWSYDDIMNKKDEFIKALKQKSKIKSMSLKPIPIGLIWIMVVK